MRASRPTATFSRTVSVSKSSMRWNVRPMPQWARLEIEVEVRSVPANRTEPAVAFTNPEQTLNVVDLPAPFGPMSPVIRPTGASRLRSCTARTPAEADLEPVDHEDVLGGVAGRRS